MTCPSAVMPAAAAQVADEVPVQRGLVLAAGLGVRAAEREVDGAADLLVEEDRADRALDAEVRADAELAEEPRAGVGRERALEVLVALLGARARRPRRRGTRGRRPATWTPAGEDGMSKWMWPLAVVSCGPVKTSPLGMLRRPSLLTQCGP